MQIEPVVPIEPVPIEPVQIEHVVVLCLENRSFDHMLGYLDHPDPRYEGLRGAGPYDNVGWDGAERVAASAGAKRVLPFGPDHSHDAVMEQLGIASTGKPWQPTNQGFVTSYERRARGLTAHRTDGLLGALTRLVRGKRSAPAVAGRGELAMLCQPSERVPVLSTLAREFAVCDHWFCSVPGETWPNRNFLHAATSDGETDIELRAYLNPTVFELLEHNGARWRVYHDDTPQLWAFPKLWDTPEKHGNWFPTAKFVEHAARGDLSAYSFIEPDHRPPLHTLDRQPIFGGAPSASTSQHPENNLVSDAAYDGFDDASADTDFARAEGLIATIYEALRANAELFEKTMLVITYDEHGGLYDHVPPPTHVPAPGGGRGLLGRIVHALWHRRTHPFDFTMLGPRVPTVIVSPHIPAGTLIPETLDHASVPATLRAIFAPAAEPLTGRDAWAPTFHHALSLTSPRDDLPDLSQYSTSTPAAAAAAAAQVETGTASAASTTAVRSGFVPPYYQDFLDQAQAVGKHLRAVGEPEIQKVTTTAGLQGAAEVTAAFQEAAHRHRHAQS